MRPCGSSGPDTDAYVASVERHASEFEERTGIPLEIEIVPSDLYFSNRIHHLLDGDARGRRLHVGPGARVGAPRGRLRAAARRVPRAGGRRRTTPRDFLDRLLRVQPLERPLRRPARRGAAARDPGQLRVVQPRVRARDPRARRARGCRRRGSEYFATARAVVERTGGRVRGFGQRGTDAWHTMYTGFATQLWSYGGVRLRRRPLRDRLARVGPRDGGLHGRAPRRRPGATGRPALVRARARLRAGPVRPDRRLRPLRRVLRGSGDVRPRRARSATRRRRSARPASAGRTCGRGRS